MSIVLFFVFVACVGIGAAGTGYGLAKPSAWFAIGGIVVFFIGLFGSTMNVVR